MNCRELLDQLDDCVDGDRGRRIGWRLRLHLWICRQCRRYLSTYRATIRLEQAAFRQDEESPAEVPDELKQSIAAALREGGGQSSTPASRSDEGEPSG